MYSKFLNSKFSCRSVVKTDFQKRPKSSILETENPKPLATFFIDTEVEHSLQISCTIPSRRYLIMAVVGEDNNRVAEVAVIAVA
jgi:hypothetical protein